MTTQFDLSDPLGMLPMIRQTCAVAVPVCYEPTPQAQMSAWQRVMLLAAAVARFKRQRRRYHRPP